MPFIDASGRLRKLRLLRSGGTRGPLRQMLAGDDPISGAADRLGRSASGGTEVISAAHEVRRHIGEAASAELTYPKIFLDSIENAHPVVVRTPGGDRLVINRSDSAALDGAWPPASIETYGGYFDWNEPGRQSATFAEAVRKAAGPGLLSLDPGLPLVRFSALQATGRVETRSEADDLGVLIYRKRRSEIEAQWQATRVADGAPLRGFVETLRRGPDLLAAMELPPVGFGPLDGLMREAGLARFLVTSPFNAELFTGLPRLAAEQLGLVCLFVPDDPEVTILARLPVGRADFRPAGRAPSLARAVADAVPAGALGIEEGHVGIGQVRQLAAAGCEPRPAVSLLRRWQDMRSGTDLAYFIAAANAVLHGIAAAERHIVRHVRSGVTEREAGAAFDQGVADFARRIGHEGRIRPYFDIIHSGERTLLPAIAGDHPLRPDHRTVKFDMGVLVHDALGCVRGCSDIARTLSPIAAIRTAHDALRLSLVDDLIPSMRPGMTGAAVHALGQDALRRRQDVLDAAGLMPEGATMDGYRRDCGHTIHRTTAGSVYFLPGAATTIEPGMLGCVEYVWPVDDMIVAVEDGYYVTESDVIPFTI